MYMSICDLRCAHIRLQGDVVLILAQGFVQGVGPLSPQTRCARTARREIPVDKARGVTDQQPTFPGQARVPMRKIAGE